MKQLSNIFKKFLFAFTVSLFLFSPSFVLAATNYGDGTYNGGNYNVGDTPIPTPTSAPAGATSTSSLSPAVAPVCNDTKPNSAPWLYGATVRGSGSILLQFSEARDPVTYYAVEFGTEKSKYQFGMANIGERGAVNYLVKSLSPNTTYYFRVRAGNGCAVGEWSNELSTTTQGLFDAFTNTNQMNTEITALETPQNEFEQKTYTVKTGDTLSSIALALFGDTKKYKDLIELNKDKYPSLLKSPSALRVGWELVVSEAGKTETGQGITQEPGETLGVAVNIKVVDEGKKPVAGAKVTLHSIPQETLSDSSGIAKFEQVEPGEHKVLIAYKNQTGEQNINIKNDSGVQEVDFTVQLRSTSPFKDPAVIVVVGILSIVAILFAIMLLRRTRPSKLHQML